jgi:hypothetical protein
MSNNTITIQREEYYDMLGREAELLIGKILRARGDLKGVDAEGPLRASTEGIIEIAYRRCEEVIRKLPENGKKIFNSLLEYSLERVSYRIENRDKVKDSVRGYG